jgi:hypothetical protein
MKGLAELLEHLHGAHEQVETFVAEFHEWRRLAVGDSLAVERRLDDGTIHWARGQPFARRDQALRRIWLRSPDRLCVEVVNDGVPVRAVGRTGETWWRWDARTGMTSGRVPSALAAPQLAVPPLLSVPALNPTMMLTGVTVNAIAFGAVRAGREVVQVHANEKPMYTTRTTELEFVLEFDVEHGTLLRRECLRQNDTFYLSEAVHAEYNVAIDDDVFEGPREGVSDVGVVPRAE